MNFLRKNNISFNNMEQLNILNDLYKIPKILDYRNKLPSNSKKKAKTILLEKRSPNHFPQYIKLVKRMINEYPKSQDKNLSSFTNREMNKYNFDSITLNRNSLYTDISQNFNRTNRNPAFITFNKDENKTNNNEFEISFVNSQEEENNKRIINNNLNRNNRFIAISPTHSSKNGIITNREKNNKKVINNIEVEENNISNDNNIYNKRHKMRYLLSKNYCGKKLIKRKYIIHTPSSIYSAFKKCDNNNNKNNFKNKLQINIDNNNKKDIEKTSNNNSTNNLNNTPIKKSNIVNINRNKRLIKSSLNKLNHKSRIQNATSDIQINRNNKIKEEIGLGIPSINKIFIRNDNNNNNEIKIKLNDLIVIEERLNDIIISLNNSQNINKNDINSINETMEFIYFYCNSSLQNKFPLYFKTQNRIIIKSAFNIHLFMVILLHYLSSNSSALNQTIILLSKIFDLLKINLYLIIRKIEIYYGEEFCQNNEIYFKVFNNYLTENDIYDLKEKEIIEIINKNCISITIDIESILNYIQMINKKYYSDFLEMYMTISKINENDIIDYFYYNLNNNNNSNNKENVKTQNKSDINKNTNIDSNENDILIEHNQENEYLDQIIKSYKKNKKIPPFIKLKNKKKYTLVLDLED